MTNQNASQEERSNWNFSHNEKWKQYWIDTELVPSKREDKQLPFLINKLKEELDINKIETILEVGVGYGRVAKAILDTFPNILYYDGIDISIKALQESRYYLRKYVGLNDISLGYKAINVDFENMDMDSIKPFDLVISVETMSTVPENIDICNWIDKMVSLSKKYVVNLDYTKTTHTIFNNGHAYETCYGINDSVKRFEIIPTPNENEKLFICRVK